MTELKSMTESRDYWYKRFCAIRKTRFSMQKDLNSANKDIGGLTETLKLANNDLTTLSREITSSFEQYSVLEDTLRDANDELESAHDEIGRLTKANEDLEERREILNKNYTLVLKMHREEEAACIKWHNKAMILETGAANSARSNTKLIADKIELDRQLHNSWRSNERLTEDGIEMRAELKDSAAERSELRKDTTDLMAAVNYWKKLQHSSVIQVKNLRATLVDLEIGADTNKRLFLQVQEYSQEQGGRIHALELFVNAANHLINHLHTGLNQEMGKISHETPSFTVERFVRVRDVRMRSIRRMYDLIEKFRQTGVDMV